MKKGEGGEWAREDRRQGRSFGLRGMAQSHIWLQAIKRD